jgi:hypothetical protein
MNPVHALILGTLACILCGETSDAAAPLLRTQAPGFYRIMLGSFEVTAILDGTHRISLYGSHDLRKQIDVSSIDVFAQVADFVRFKAFININVPGLRAAIVA